LELGSVVLKFLRYLQKQARLIEGSTELLGVSPPLLDLSKETKLLVRIAGHLGMDGRLIGGCPASQNSAGLYGYR
jgi:hypothetical protein